MLSYYYVNFNCLLSGSDDGLLKSWNLDICDFADNFVGHAGPVTCLAISSDHSFAISGSVDATLKVWSLILATIITNYRVNYILC